MTDKPVILVDGSSFLYRAFYAMPNLMTTARQPTGAVYGIINMLKQLLKQYHPQLMAVIFDAPGKTFRHTLYTDYKANRSAMPDTLVPQVIWVKEIIQAMGLPLISIKEVEADDVIGTLAKQAEKSDVQLLICSGDKDLMQLVTPKTTVIDTMKAVAYDVEGVKAKFGVYPDQMIDYLTLVGDSSDNIPGVPKVGPKTAAKWLGSYKTLDNLVVHADDIKGAAGNNLRAALTSLPTSKALTTIKCDLELNLPIIELQVKEPDEDRLRELYSQLEFKAWLSDLGGKAQAKTIFDRADTEIIDSESTLEKWIGRLLDADVFALDTESTSIIALNAELVGISFADNQGAAYLPLAHIYDGVPKQLEREFVLKRLQPLLEARHPAKVLQNLKYDLAIFRNYSINIANAYYDTMLESYILDSTASRHDMDTLALKHLGYKTLHYEELAGKGKTQLRFDQIPIEQAAPYAGEDAAITLLLHKKLWPKLIKTGSVRAIFEEIEMPLVAVLEEMERNGVKVNVDKLNTQSDELRQQIESLERQAHDCAGQVFNLASPKQLQEILFEKQNLPVLKKTPKGQPSTAEDVLQELASEHELPALILEHRSLSKLRSTYTIKLPKLVSAKTGRIHTSYHQAVAATGRLSSSDPNLQNIPVRTPQGRRIREAFEPEAGNLLLAADYSQIELRIMAHLSEDLTLLNAFSNGEDIHSTTAAEVFNVKLNDVNADQRRHAKAINFGLIYGMSAFGLSKQLNISRQQAQDYIDLYFERYPGVKNYMDETRKSARGCGYVETIYGRRLYLPEINSSNFTRRQYAERTAINAPMQGSAADIIKLAMLEVYRKLPDISIKSKLLMQVHDELVLEVPNADITKVCRAIKEIMTDIAQLQVPLVVETGFGENWAQAH